MFYPSFGWGAIIILPFLIILLRKAFKEIDNKAKAELEAKENSSNINITLKFEGIDSVELNGKEQVCKKIIL